MCVLPQEVADNLKREERETGRGRKWRRHFLELNQQLMALEDDETALERVFPQVHIHTFPAITKSRPESSYIPDGFLCDPSVAAQRV